MTNARNAHLRSVEMVIRMLDVIANDPGLTLSQIAREVGVAKSTAHRAGLVLMRGGLVERDESLRYRLGTQLVEYGAAALRSSPIGEHSMRVLADLRAAAGLTVQLGMPVGGDVVFVQRIDVSPARPMSWRAPVHRSSAGKVLAAWNPEVLKARLDGGLPRRTGYTIVVPQVLCDELERVRQRGYARSTDEAEIGTSSLAVPVRDPDAGDQVVAAISIVGRTAQLLGGSREATNVRRLKAAAQQLAQQIEQSRGIAGGSRIAAARASLR